MHEMYVHTTLFDKFPESEWKNKRFGEKKNILFLNTVSFHLETKNPDLL